MLKRIILVGCFVLFSLNISANEAELAKEAKQYKNLKELCLKSKEWSPYGRIKVFLRWKGPNCYFKHSKKIKASYDKYYALAPYVFSNMKKSNMFLSWMASQDIDITQMMVVDILLEQAIKI